MANGLMGLQNLLGQSSNASSGGLLGGGVFSQPQTRGQRRSRLLTEAISGAGQNPYSRLGAAVGGLLGIGARAGAESLGIVDKPPEVQRAEAIRQVQQEAAERGLNVADDPRAFGNFVVSRFQELGQNDLANLSALQVESIARRLAPEPVETEIRFVGGTPRAEALQKRYPQVGKVEDGQEITLTLSDGEFRAVKAGKAPKEDKPVKGQQVEIVDPQDGNVKLGTYDPIKQKYYIDGRVIKGARPAVEEDNRGFRTASATDAQIGPFKNRIQTSEDFTTRIEAIAGSEDPSKFLGVNIPFTGDKGNVETVTEEVSLLAKEERDRAAAQGQSISLDQAIENVLNRMGAGEVTGGAQDGGPAGPAAPANDPYAGKIN